MSEDLEQLTKLAEAMVAGMSAEQRRRATRAMGAELRRAQAARIAAQVNPDGTPFEPRKPRLRSHHKVADRAKAKRGAVARKAMFVKLRTNRFLRAKTDADTIEVGFTGQAARIAWVHQEGLRDKIDPKHSSVEATYPIRRLLGVAGADRERLLDRLIGIFRL
ncbi:phage virion morphogenesis protein [Sphingomonas oryzagri]